jgi:hypothetical protein
MNGHNRLGIRYRSWPAMSSILCRARNSTRSECPIANSFPKQSIDQTIKKSKDSDANKLYVVADGKLF